MGMSICYFYFLLNNCILDSQDIFYLNLSIKGIIVL